MTLSVEQFVLRGNKTTPHDIIAFTLHLIFAYELPHQVFKKEIGIEIHKIDINR